MALWQCPHFLFLAMGLIIIFAILATDAVAKKYLDPGYVALIVLGVTAMLFTISYIVVSSFERVAKMSMAKSEFLRIMSHQLRTPLSGIKWQLELLFSKKINPSMEVIREALLEIKERNEKMVWVVNNILDVNLIEDSNFSITSSVFSLKDVVNEVVGMLKEAAEKANIQIFVAAPQELPDICADKMRVKNIVYHLVDNAIRYSMNRGNVTITLESTPGFARCVVSDEGVGIPKKDTSRIFEKFFRSKNTLPGQTAGTGVGLYLAKMVIEKSGGKIGFTSAEGKGSTFWFTLPINKS